MVYKCGHCGYEGPCYGTPTGQGVSAPWCYNCGKNDKLTKIEPGKQKKEKSQTLVLYVDIIKTVEEGLDALFTNAAKWVKEHPEVELMDVAFLRWVPPHPVNLRLYFQNPGGMKNNSV